MLPLDVAAGPSTGSLGPGPRGLSREVASIWNSGLALSPPPSAARLAASSACSFPSIPLWAGVRRTVTLMPRSWSSSTVTITVLARA